MKLNEVLSGAEEQKPGYLGSDEAKRYLCLIESALCERPVVLGDGDELSVPEPFSEIYLLYLKAQAELKWNEIQNYNNTFVLLRSLVDDYKRFRKRSGGYSRRRFRLI